MTYSHPVKNVKGNYFKIPSFNLGGKYILTPSFWKKLDQFTLEKNCDFLIVREEFPLEQFTRASALGFFILLIINSYAITRYAFKR